MPAMRDLTALVRSLRSIALLAIIMVVVSAHIGSPDAWYDGAAGPYRVLIHVEAPAVVPGIAIVNVRASDAGVTRVTAFVNRFDATGGTPPPDVATPVPDSPGWYRTRLWVMTSGSNSVTVTVEGQNGKGTVVVPLTAVAGRRLSFNAPLAAVLGVAGLVLALGLVSLAGAAVREGVLAPGAEPDAARRRRARGAMARVVVVLALAVVGTGAWWRAEDRSFARNLFRPMTIGARADADSLRVTIDDSAWTHRNDLPWLRARRLPQRGDLIEDHGKLVHLFLISMDGRNVFAHLHPITRDTVAFSAPIPPLPAGPYRVFADVVHASGFTQTMTTLVDVRGDAGTPEHPDSDPDDSWAIATPVARSGDTSRVSLGDGTTLAWQRGDAPLVATTEANLRFTVTPPPGDSAPLEPYLGMEGHAVVVRDDARVFIHLHPLGTISLAAQSRLVPAGAGEPMHHATTAPSAAGDTLYFPYAFPQPGNYTVWVQLKRRGRVLTGAFPVEVAATAR